MRRQHHPRKPHHPEAPQFDLFHPLSPEPEWRRLPPEARETVTRLMARLMVEHEQGGRAVPAGGRRHD